MAILEVRHIEKNFGPTRVLKDISFSLEEGQVGCVGTVRTNGKAGTTRPLRAVAFRRQPTGTYIKGSGSGKLTGGQAHRREGRASP